MDDTMPEAVLRTSFSPARARSHDRSPLPSGPPTLPGPRTLSRRDFLRVAGSAASLGVGMSLVPVPLSGLTSPGGSRVQPLRIGIIGSGDLGGSVGLAWAEAGHEIFFSSRNPDQLGELVEQAGGRARAGYPDEAAEFGEVVLIAVPYMALPQVGEDYAHLMQGKVVIEVGNPQETDGPMHLEALEKGTGVASAEFLPGVRLVRAFNAIAAFHVRAGGLNQDGERVGVPIAGDDPEAIEITTGLVEDAGFEPVVVGGLARAEEFDIGTPVWVRGMTAEALREALDL